MAANTTRFVNIISTVLIAVAAQGCAGTAPDGTYRVSAAMPVVENRTPVAPERVTAEDVESARNELELMRIDAEKARIQAQLSLWRGISLAVFQSGAELETSEEARSFFETNRWLVEENSEPDQIVRDLPGLAAPPSRSTATASRGWWEISN